MLLLWFLVPFFPESCCQARPSQERTSEARTQALTALRSLYRHVTRDKERKKGKKERSFCCCFTRCAQDEVKKEGGDDEGRLSSEAWEVGWRWIMKVQTGPKTKKKWTLRGTKTIEKYFGERVMYASNVWWEQLKRIWHKRKSLSGQHTQLKMFCHFYESNLFRNPRKNGF